MSNASIGTNASSASSARIKEEARIAELIARSVLLKKQQALEDEEIRIRRMKEEFKLESDLAIANEN